jgi:hypothetical protein
VITAEVLAATGVVEAVNVPETCPAATVTDDGTVTPIAVPLLERPTTNPPVGAADEIVTVPVVVAPPTTVFGEKPTLTRVGAATARLAVLEVDASVPVMVAVTFEATAVVDTVKVADV